jgi:hypothetical protein
MFGAADRVRETSTTTGTGNLTLLGAYSGEHVTFNNAVGVGPEFTYFILLAGGSQWETGRGVLSGATTLVRSTPKNGSSGAALVDFAAGTKDVYIDVSADDINKRLLAQLRKAGFLFR